MNSTETVQLFLPLLAVVIGGLLTITGGFVSNVLLERRRYERESKSLALAFRGEISALLHHINTRNYAGRFAAIIHQIEETREPFYTPFHIRYEYNSVYKANVNRIGTLRDPLPEMVATFYTQLTSVLEDMGNLGDGVYKDLDLKILLRIYRDMLRLVEDTQQLGGQIIRTVDQQYPRNSNESQKDGQNMI